MQNKKIDFKKVLIPSDAVPIMVIIVGLIIALFLHEVAIRLIGISVSILGAVSLFMLISQRISDSVDIRFKPGEPPKNYTVTKKKSAEAVRTVIENFDVGYTHGEAPTIKKIDTIKIGDGVKADVIKKEIIERPQEPIYKEVFDEERITTPGVLESVDEPEDGIEEYMDGGEGFRIIKKSAKIEFKQVLGSIPLTPVPEPQMEPVVELKPEIPIVPIAVPHEEFVVAEKPEEIIPEPEIKEVYQPQQVHEVSFVRTIKEEIPVQKVPEPVEAPPDYLSYKEREIIQPKEETPQYIPQPVAEAESVILEGKTEQYIPVKEQIHADEEAKFVAKEVDLNLAALMEDIPILGQEPRKEFEYFLERILMTIRSVTNTRTAAFILVNAAKRQLILESYVSDIEKSITPKKKIPLGNDVVSQIILTGKPEILTEINPSAELDLIPYYIKPSNTSSFIGIPVFYDKKVIGVICSDTNNSNAYDSITVSFLGHFSKLISALVQSYTDKYDLLQASRTLEAINHFRDIMNKQTHSISDILASMVEAASSIIEYDTIGICGYDESQGGWTILARHSKSDRPDLALSTPVMLENSLIGESIIMNKNQMYSPLDGNIIRLNEKEMSLDGGFFASVPIPLKTFNIVFGAIFIEGHSIGGLSQYDMDILDTLCEQAGSCIEMMHFVDMLESAALYDYQTGILNRLAFERRLEEELIRTSDFNFPASFCLFRIDKYASYDPEKYQDRLEKILYHVFGIVRKHLRPYDIFGRYDNDTFGIVLAGMKVEQAQVWAGRLRQEVAISVIEIDQSRFTVTISMGLSSLNPKDNIDNLVRNTEKVLLKSLDKTNTVTVYG